MKFEKLAHFQSELTFLVKRSPGCKPGTAGGRSGPPPLNNLGIDSRNVQSIKCVVMIGLVPGSSRSLRFSLFANLPW